MLKWIGIGAGILVSLFLILAFWETIFLVLLIAGAFALSSGTNEEFSQSPGSGGLFKLHNPKPGGGGYKYGYEIVDNEKVYYRSGKGPGGT